MIRIEAVASAAVAVQMKHVEAAVAHSDPEPVDVRTARLLLAPGFEELPLEEDGG
jgi:hypothetical protein